MINISLERNYIWIDEIGQVISTKVNNVVIVVYVYYITGDEPKIKRDGYKK